MWKRLLLDNFFFRPLAMLVLIPATLYATARNKERLPWGLNWLFGCEEDGWNGNGIDPNNPRKFWIPNKWGVYHPKGTQGWWPDYKKEDWSTMSFLKRWWRGYQWCALRNVTWNLRLTDWYAVSIHKDEITIDKLVVKDNYVEALWHIGKKSYYFKRRPIFGYCITWGWEFYPYMFLPEHSEYERFQHFGYQWEHKYKHRSVPSIRIKKIQ
jgi:hypothetical protein